MTHFSIRFVFAACLLFQCFCEGAARQIRFVSYTQNLWHECTKVPDGVNNLIEQVWYINPDIATFCELFPGNEDSVIERLTGVFEKRGRKYYYAKMDGRAIVSRHLIIETKRINQWCFKAVLDVYGTRIVVYPSHSEYRFYSCYLPRGYGDGSENWGKLPEPITDVMEIERIALLSGRTESARMVVEDAKTEIAEGSLVLYQGDFNEPSHLDWTRATADSFDHRGCSVKWPLSKYMIETARWKDAYREAHPNPVKYPGITWPTACPQLDESSIAWAKEADERDRIDFIYYHPDHRIKVKDAFLAGYPMSLRRAQAVCDESSDKFVISKNAGWFSDHRGVVAVFKINVK